MKSIWLWLQSEVHVKLNSIISTLTQVVSTQRKMQDTLDKLVKQGDRISMANQQIQDALDKLNQATNDEAALLDGVQSRLDALATQVQGGVSNNEVGTIVSQLSAMSNTVSAASDRLKQMATDPNNPVPAPTPAPAEPPSPAQGQ